MKPCKRKYIIASGLCVSIIFLSFHPLWAMPPHKNEHRDIKNERVAMKDGYFHQGNKTEQTYKQGNGPNYNESRQQKKASNRSLEQGKFFRSQDRAYVHNYYSKEFKAGNCPPGLAKKNNGCMPPGQARKWRLGYPLPSDIVIYGVPQTIITHLGAPPAGYKFIRVAQDILLVSIGTGMVIDAIQDIGNVLNN